MQAASGRVTPTIVMMTADGKVYRIGGMYSVSSGQIEIYNDVKSINSYSLFTQSVKEIEVSTENISNGKQIIAGSNQLIVIKTKQEYWKD